MDACAVELPVGQGHGRACRPRIGRSPAPRGDLQYYGVLPTLMLAFTWRALALRRRPRNNGQSWVVTAVAASRDCLSHLRSPLESAEQWRPLPIIIAIIITIITIPPTSRFTTSTTAQHRRTLCFQGFPNGSTQACLPSFGPGFSPRSPAWPPARPAR